MKFLNAVKTLNLVVGSKWVRGGVEKGEGWDGLGWESWE